MIPVEKHGEVIGQLDKRLFNLENDNTFSAWEKWFGKHPMVVVGIVITALCAGFWGFYAWTIDRLDRTGGRPLALAPRCRPVALLLAHRLG